MLKRIAIPLLVLFALLTVVYFMRVQVATNLVNSTLSESGLQIMRLDSLEVGWRGLNIDYLRLGVGKGKTPQELWGIELSYALLETRTEHLSIRRASLQLPPAARDEPAAPLLLTELVQSLSSAPLESLDIDALEITGAVMPLVEQPLSLAASLRSGRLTLTIEDAVQTRLELSLRDRGQRQTEAVIQLATYELPVLSLALSTKPQGERLRLTGSGRADVERLVDLTAPALPLPAPVVSAAGDIPFAVDTLMDDDLNAVLNTRGELSLDPGAQLQLQLAPAEEGRPPVTDLEVAWPEGMKLGIHPPESDEPRISLEAAAVSVSGREPRGTFRGNLSSLHCSDVMSLTCGGEMDFEAHIPEMEIAGDQSTSLSDVKALAAATFALDQGILSLDWKPGPLLNVLGLRQGEIQLRKLALVADTAGTLEYDQAHERFTVEAGSLSLLLPRVKLPDINIATRLTFSDLSLQVGADSSLVAGTRLTADGINLQRPGGWLPALALASDISLARNQVIAVGQLHSDQQKSLLSFSALHDLGTGQGAGRLSTDQASFDPDANRLSQFFSHWPFELDVYEGTLSLQGEFDWLQEGSRFELQGEMANRFEDLSGVYGELGFIGLSGSIPLALPTPDRLFTPVDAMISLEQIDVGVPVENLSARFRVDTAKRELFLKSVEARLFGGRVWTEDALYRADHAANRIDIGVDGLQLDQLLALAGYDAVEGTGSISGLLPLDIGTAGITMERGMLAARAPGGVFRYRSDIVPGTNPAVAQAMQALSNYHYSVFQTEADYLESGDLELSMTLRGRNPDMDRSRPIHLNLNVTDNIPMLLKSLQAGRAITDIVSRKVGGPR